jgi:heme exporter protein A
MAEAMRTLRAEDLACRRGERLLFAGLRFALAPGEAIWLRGANGSGKTTLLRTVAGLSRPERGRVLWGDEPAAGLGGFRRALRYVGHAHGLKDDLTVRESLAFAAALQGLPAAPEAISAALQSLGLQRRAQAPVRTLSQGQRRRTALARLLLDPRPALWVLDEPFDALDAEGGRRLDALLAAHTGAGGSVLLASHRPPADALRAHALDLDEMR